ncbi:MAG: hypothetical protein EXS06_12125 [Planctomycetaceae bacterium]|nr:hypothetical protein [Planctomycetaceae bacterium]
MSAAPSRLILVDPCLDGPGSHPWQYAVAVLGAARRRGWGCDLVCRSSAELPAAALLGWRVWPVLRFPGASKLTAFAELDRLAPDGRPRWQPPWLAWIRRQRRRERVAAFATDLAPVVADLAPGDQLLVATASELDALGLAQAIDAACPPTGIGWHLQFHTPLLPPPPAEPDIATSRIARVGRCLEEAIRRAAPHQLRFHAPTGELAAEWSQVGAEAISMLPYPVDGILETAPDPSRPILSGDRFRVALLGDARSEKNSHLTPALLERIVAIPTCAARLRFAIQTNPGFNPRSRRPADILVAAALGALADRDDALVERLAGPLAVNAYRNQLQLADVFLLPYDQRCYRQRCSAILLEALASGKVPIVTGGGWMARCLLPALRSHVDRLEREYPLAGVETIGPGAIAAGAGRQLPVLPPAGAGLVVVEVSWAARGAAAFLAAPVSVTFGADATPAAAILQADPTGLPVPVVFRLRRPSDGGGPLAFSFGPAFPGGGRSAALAEVCLRWLHGGQAAALARVGIVTADAAGGAAALAEFVDHAGHYRATAAEAAGAFRRAHAPEKVLEGFLA